MIDIMQAHSLNRLRIDWDSFRAQVLKAAGDAQSTQAAYPAISTALGLLNDRHSFYTASDGTFVSNPTVGTCVGLRLAVSPPLPANIGWIPVPSFSATDADPGTAYAEAIQARIRQADVSDLAGWIIDVRGNGGGTLYPMLAGIGPVLGNGIAGYIVGPVSDNHSFGYVNGRATYDEQPTLPFPSAPYSTTHPLAKVAVLTDTGTASSGEAVVVAFRGRPRTRSFGTPTCGASTGNTAYALGDGGVLVLTTGVMADRAMVQYGGPIVPDDLAPWAESLNHAADWILQP